MTDPRQDKAARELGSDGAASKDYCANHRQLAAFSQGVEASRPAMREGLAHGRLPAYGRELVAAQRAGRNVPWLLIALDWNIGRAMPRVVATPGVPASALDLALVRALACLVAHRDEPQRALEIAEAALQYGARCCPIFDISGGTIMATADVVAARGPAAGCA